MTCDYPFPNINKAQVKPLKITILTINTGSSDQVGSSYVRFLPLEKELRSPNSVINTKHTDLGPIQTNPLSDLHEIVIDGINLIVRTIAQSTVLAKLPH